MESVGRTNFDGLNLMMMEKRYANRWGARLAYSFSYSRGDTCDQWEGIDIFNLTDHANFNNPTGDQRRSNFLNLITLRGGSGFPRQAQFGVRYGFYL